MCFLGSFVSMMANEGLIRALGDLEYHQRERAINRIVVAAAADQAGMIGRLLKAERHEDPEISARASVCIERIFMRFEKGYGAPEIGLEIKSKLVSVKMKLATRPLVSSVKEGSVSEAGGLRKGDLILSVDGVTFDGEDGVEELSSLLNKQTSGSELSVRYSRKSGEGREEFETTLKLARGKPIPERLDKDRPEFEIWKRTQIERLKNKPLEELTPE